MVEKGVSQTSTIAVERHNIF